jgi:hypothetical protein
LRQLRPVCYFLSALGVCLRRFLTLDGTAARGRLGSGALGVWASSEAGVRSSIFSPNIDSLLV